MVLQISKFIRSKRRWLIPFIFILMAFLDVIYLWHFKTVYYNSDFMFHLYRIRGIRNALLSGNYPIINWGTTIPYGTALSFYPWLTILPLSLITIFIHNGVTIFYITALFVIIISYFVSYYSAHTFNTSWLYDFLFTLLYTNSSILFVWLFRSGDIGCSLAIAFSPLAFFGFLDLMLNNRHWLMLAIGMTLVISSHLITGGLLALTLLILSILNIKKFKFTSICKALLALIIFIILTSLFWIPDLKILNFNDILSPGIGGSFGRGLVNWIGSPANYVYSLPEIIGLLSFINIKNKKFNWTYFTIWLLGLFSVLFNVKLIADNMAKMIPFLKKLQFSYRISTISHILLTFMAIQWLCGALNDKGTNKFRGSLLLISIFMILSPLVNEVGHHFLLHNRPIATSTNINKLVIARTTPMKFTKKSFYQLRHRYYGYDYAPNKTVTKNEAFDMNYKAIIFNRNNVYKGVMKYTPTNYGIIFNNHDYYSIQLPIELYRGIDYHFDINGKPLKNKEINYKITRHSYDLTLRNLPKGKNIISLKSAILFPKHKTFDP